MKIVSCSKSNFKDWLALRKALWPETSESKHKNEMDTFLREPKKYFQIICYIEEPVAFVEASVRTDYVNGTDKSPVVFLEGIYVNPDYRRKGIAGSLVNYVVDWASEKGISELASDALINNLESHAMHKALGFEETERVVFFKKVLSE